MKLPVVVEDFTSAWFSDILKKDVRQIDLLEQNEGTTGRARFSLTGGSDLPKSVFVKLPPNDPQQRELVKMVGMGVTEVKFYQHLANDIPVRVPKPYFADTDGETYVMVLEDLTLTNCRFPTIEEKDMAMRIKDLLEQLAIMHSQFWESPRFKAGDLNWLRERGTGTPDGGADFIKLAASYIAPQFPPAFLEIANYYIEHAPAIVKLYNQGERTLVHGDDHIGNLFVDNKLHGRTGFLDWALVSYSPGIRDVAYILTNSVPTDLRMKYEREWIKYYCDLLSQRNITLDFEVAWNQYRLFAIYAWVSATATAAMGAKWQPVALSFSSVVKATAACEQLDSLGLIKSLLD